MKRKKRIIFISPFFAPLANAEAFCNGKLVNELLKDGFHLKVITVDYSENSKFSYDRSSIWERLESVTVKIPPHSNSRKFCSFLSGCRYQSVEWSRWINGVVKAAIRLHNECPFDMIYSRGLPNVAHIAGYWIAKKLNIKWIANFNDPWDLEGTHLLPQFRDKRERSLSNLMSDRWLRIVMHQADAITFPCERLKDYHLRLVDRPVRHWILPHIGIAGDGVLPSNKFRLLHAGSLGSGESTRIGSTRSLLNGLRRFLDRCPEARACTELLLVGKEDPTTLAIANQLNLGSIVSSTGRVSYQESIDFIGSASVCMLVEGSMPEGIYLPSKFVDYIASSKPVIALSPEIGTIADISHLRGITRVNVDDKKGIEEAIGVYFDAFKNGVERSFFPSKELLRMFEASNIVNVLQSAIDEVLSEQQFE